VLPHETAQHRFINIIYTITTTEEILAVFQDLLSLSNITLEDRATLEQASANFGLGFDFTDALHHASYQNCECVVSFDDKKFARKAVRIGLNPVVIVPNR
jgi:predicted nucleic acid-binding protein